MPGEGFQVVSFVRPAPPGASPSPVHFHQMSPAERPCPNFGEVLWKTGVPVQKTTAGPSVNLIFASDHKHTQLEILLFSICFSNLDSWYVVETGLARLP